MGFTTSTDVQMEFCMGRVYFAFHGSDYSVQLVELAGSSDCFVFNIAIAVGDGMYNLPLNHSSPLYYARKF